ncbi:MAG: DinB family protein [Bacteroidetes bacterium]|nr:DinB family protein [Bacteroidota bacterium]
MPTDIRDIIIPELERNIEVFRTLLEGLTEEVYHWRFLEGKWTLLEIVCHLYDEECDDFRARVKHTLETPLVAMPPIDPSGWVLSREYSRQNFDEKLKLFLSERKKSVEWLRILKDPIWDNTYHHPSLGPLTASMFLANWLAHDYLHIRQIMRLKYEYTKAKTGENLNYAGAW